MRREVAVTGAMESAVRGGLRPPQLITWLRSDGTCEDLTDGMLSGLIRNRATGALRPVAGPLTVVDGAKGQFLWQYAPEDVQEAGEFDVQFDAAFPQGPTPARSYMARWTVKEALG